MLPSLPPSSFAPQASVQLVTIQNMYSHHAIDYGYQINTINCTKGFEILHNVSAVMATTICVTAVRESALIGGMASFSGGHTLEGTNQAVLNGFPHFGGSD